VLSLRNRARKQPLEERFFQARRLASLGRVVEGVAHEVRNPLISIGGFARKLRGEVPEGACAQYLDVILSEVRRLEKMVAEIEEYVTFARHRSASLERLEIRAVLERVLLRVRTRPRRPGVQVHLEAPAEAPRIYGEPELLEELFSGLVENACDAMPNGGDLWASVNFVENWVRIRISDTGVGIPQEELRGIFDPVVTSKTSGTGLGLTKAYIIVEEHAGSIEFESQIGKGTACTVSLPIDRRRVPRDPS
jgi:signal transduction histidine kinase